MSGLLPGRLQSAELQGTSVDREARRSEARRVLAVQLGPVGRCPDVPVLLIGCFDNSGSVAGVGGNDPCSNRFAEAQLAIEAVSRRCDCGEELVALLNFDSPTSADVKPTALRNGMASIERGLTIPADGGGSSILGPSLGMARQLAAQYSDHHAVLCVLSDFELYDGDVPGVLTGLANFPGQVHAVALRTVPPQRLTDDPRVVVSRVNQGDPPGTLARAVFSALTATRRFRKKADPPKSLRKVRP